MPNRTHPNTNLVPTGLKPRPGPDTGQGSTKKAGKQPENAKAGTPSREDVVQALTTHIAHAEELQQHAQSYMNSPEYGDQPLNHVRAGVKVLIKELRVIDKLLNK